MKLSDQAIGVLMMALQKSLLEQTDIVPLMKELNFAQMDNNQLLVENPPDIKVGIPVKSSSVQTKVTETETPSFVYEQGNNSNA
tara:strand:+ start:396 stop:647 length:252 start_codon:yes stop_codon:yes gene_type:complete